MKNFNEHISNIADNMRERKDIFQDITDVVTDKAVDLLFSTATTAADILNGNIDGEAVKIFRLEDEIVPLLFAFTDNGRGFVAIMPGKYIFFITNNSGVIYTYGLDKSIGKQGGNPMKNCIQLLTISYGTTQSSVEYRDSTGVILDPQEIIYHLFKWGSG